MKNCTRFFTQELIDEIRMRLAAIQGAKDSQFEKATHFNKEDQVAIVQQGKNKRIEIGEFKNWLYAMDNTPTLGSENAVTSDGIYKYILNIIDSIVSEGKYLYIKGDSNMFDYLIHGPGDIYTQEQYDIYCNEVYNAIANGYFVIVDDAICVTGYTDDPQFFSLSYISPAENVVISALMENQHWVKRSGKVDVNRFLIDNTYLKDNLYATINNVTALLTNYITNEDLARLIENYPQQDSAKLVTSGGVWLAIQNALTNVISLSDILIISDTMMETLITGEPGTSYYNECYDTIFNACKKGSLVIFDCGICNYNCNETELQKTFNLTVITTSNTYSLYGTLDKESTPLNWYPHRQNTVTLNRLVTSTQLSNTLQSYYTKSLIDALLSTLLGHVNTNTTNINNLRQDYEERMASTPKYHKANWLEEEVDQLGRVTSETSASTPNKRFESMWWAVKEDKLITIHGIPDIYRESNVEVSTPNTVTSIIVKFLISDVMTTYTIRKVSEPGTPLYLLVIKQESSLSNAPTRIGVKSSTQDNLTVIGNTVSRLEIDLSHKLDGYQTFNDIGSIGYVPLVVDNPAYEGLLGNVKVIACGGLDTSKTDYANLCTLFGNPAITLYGDITEDNGYLLGSIYLDMNEDDEVIIHYIDSETNETYEINTITSTNDNIAAFINSILRRSDVINNNNLLALLLEAFRCTIAVSVVSEGLKCFVRNNGTYIFNYITQMPELEIAEI